MKRMVRTDVVSYLQLLDSWPTKCVEEVVESRDVSLAKLGESFKGEVRGDQGLT